MTSHTDRMIARRANQLDRTPGFTPVPNRRVTAAMNSAMALLSLDEKFKGDIRGEAMRIVARKLPQLTVGTRTRAFRETSKYNQANTRGNR